MSEFKLGRIRFVWQGTWAPGSVYVADDVVSNGGKSYICIRNHTASPEFTTDFTSELPKWDVVSDGTSWRSNWEPSTPYNPGDVVKYGALIYICEEGHSSATYEAPEYLGLEEDLSKWTPFATSFNWVGNWAVATRYRINDLVKYGGFTYLCNEAHVSASTAAFGLENDQERWTLFNEGLNFLGEWNSPVRYRQNDIVKYGGNLWICTEPHTSSDFISDEANWATFIEGFEFQNSWDNATAYQPGDTVSYGGYTYVAKRNNVNSQPTQNQLDWEVFTKGFNFQGDWSGVISYRVGDVVRVSGNTYIAVLDSTNQIPPNTTYWNRLNYGIAWTNNARSYLGVLGSTITGTGSSARFDVIRSNTVYTVSVSAGFAGTSYVAGNTIRISGASLGGLAGSNDLIITVTSVSSGAITGISWAGYSSTWTASVSYNVGDVVLYGASSFICVQNHSAATGNRPDNDVTAQYWNLLALGSESLVLTTPGDLVYYGDNGPTRLPIGVDGQIIRAQNGFPEWANYGLINNVVYVGPLGTDEPAPSSGLTIDRPWRSVRYALRQVQDGYLNPNARDILKNNKQFLMKEVTNWITYTYTVNITASTAGTQVFTCNSTANLSAGMPIEFSGTIGGVTAGTMYYVEAVTSPTQFRISNTLGGVPRVLTTASGTMTGTLSYDSTFCERDTGLIVDALIYDISRGGTLKTTTAVQAYFTPAGNAYITSNFGTQTTQTVAAYNYLKTLVATVLNNDSAISYQAENNVDISERAVQIVDFNLVAESTGVEKTGQLIDIITNGITAGSSTAVAPAINPNTTVFIKTGTYNEILPIILPEYTAIVGDELRTSVVQPAFAIPLLANDKPKTTSALNRIKELLPDIVSNNEIVPTTGNIEEQQYINDYSGNTVSSARLTSGVNLIKDVIVAGLSVANDYEGEFGSSPTGGTNNASTPAFANATAQLISNKEFIKAEITAWIAVQVAGNISPFTSAFTYDSAACARDVGYILDAICYDLTYGGNLETIVAARAYFVNGSPVYGAGEKEETLAAYARLKTVVGQIILETTVTTSAGNLLDQNTDGDAGNSTSATFAESRVQEVYDTINTDGTLPSEVVPDLSWVPGHLQIVNNGIVSIKSTVQSDAIAWVQENYPGFTFDTVKCSRDVGFMIDALRYDIMFNSMFRSLKAGMSYRRGIASTALVLSDQLPQTLGLIDFVKSQLTYSTNGAYHISNNCATISDILENGLGVVPAFNYPVPTTYDTGFNNGRRLLIANKSFLQEEITAWIAVQVAGNISPFTSSFTYDSVACERDVGYIVDAIVYDITYGGNLETIVAARSYFSNGLPVYGDGEKEETIAAYTYLKSIIDNIVQGSAIVKSSGNLLTQDTSGTSGSLAAATFAQDRVQDVLDTLDTEEVPEAIIPSLTWVDSGLVAAKDAILAKKEIIQSGAIGWVNMMYPELEFNQATCSRDVGYIVDALVYDLMFGSNFRSVKSGMSYRRALSSTAVVLADQLEPTLGIIRFIEEAVSVITATVVGSTGTVTAAWNAASLAETIKSIINSGLTAVPTLQLPNPRGYNTSALTDAAYASTGNTTGNTATYSNARAQLVANYAFIKAEISAWLANPTNGYDTIWSALGATGQAACIRDVGYILDAIRYDITYGGNTQSLIVGSSYYSNFVLTIGSNELAATTAAYGRLKTIIGQIVQETTVTKSPGNALTQDTSGTAGNAVSAAFAQARVQDVIDWIDNGQANTTVYPATSWANPDVRESFNAIIAKKIELREDTVYWVEKYWQKIRYNQETCRRDAGYMVDAIAYDMLTGSNFASIKSGMSYYRATSSAQEVVNNEREATIGAVNFLKHKIKRIAAVSASAAAQVIIDDVTGYINGGAVPSLRWTASNDTDSADLAAANLIYDNKEFVKAEVIQYITDNYPAIVYSQEVCARDVGYIVDALRYDLTYGGHYASKQAGQAYYSFSTLQIDSGDKTATLAAYTYLKSLVEDIANNTAITPLQTLVTQVRADSLQSVGDANSVTAVGNLVDVITNIVDQGLELGVPSITVTQIASTTTFTSVTHGLKIGDEVKATTSDNGLTVGTTYYVKAVATPDTFTLSTFLDSPVITDFTNGTGLSIVLEITKLPAIAQVSTSLRQQHINLMGSKATIQAAITEYIVNNYPTLVYDQDLCERDIGYILDAVGYDMMFDSNFRTVKAATSYYRAASSAVIGNQKTATVQSFRFLKNLIETYISTVNVAVSRANSLMDIVIEVVDKGVGDTPQINGTTTYNNNVKTVKGRDIIKSNIAFLANEATAWIEQNFGGIVDETTSGTNVISTVSAHNLSVGDPVVFAAGIFGGLFAGTTYYVVAVPSTNTFKVSAVKNGTAVSLTNALGNIKVTYAFDQSACRRDMSEYLKAICYDLDYPGNHKAIKAAELYLNAVNGSQRSDMFHVRNSTGIRNMTLNGLSGNLTEENEFGTRRPTAGAYVSLAPGYGPTDSESWINNKSCYVQNVTNFGVGCTGCKIDGSLHAGGNRSIVANDFTQILSDGIGVWCSGNDSLTELVSVFSYYNYSGYLAELGGRIRATNGNSSYGTYGVIAEGTDTGEIPLFGFVDNYAQQAIVGEVVTDGDNEVLRFEFVNAGSNYSNAEYAISGSGFNAAAIDDEFRDAAVFETRLVDLNDSNGVGGADYVTARNVAQGGDRVTIQLAATDTALSNAYAGMRVQITAGSGVGQYANILSYNNGTKVATVYKDSFVPLTVTATTATTNVITVGTTAGMYTNMPIYLGTAVGGLSANTVYYVTNVTSTTQFTVSDTEGGANKVLTTTTGQSVTLYAAGWDHVVPGRTISAGLDLTTGYEVEPRISYTAPGYTATARTMASSASWGNLVYGNGRFIAVNSSGTATNYSVDGKTWTAGGTVPNTTYTSVAFGGGQGATARAVVGGLGGSGAVLEAVLGTVNSIGLPGPTQVASVRVIDGGVGYTTPPTIKFTATLGGDGAEAVCTVLNGKIQEVIMVSTGAGYGAAPTVSVETNKITSIEVLTYGKGYTSVPTVTISGGGASVQATATAVLNNTGVLRINLDTTGTGYTSQPTVTITDPIAKFVAIASGATTTAYLAATSAASTNWTTGNALPNSNFKSLAYGNAIYIAVGGTGGAGGAASSTDGISWISRTNTTLPSGTYSAVAFGNGTFVAIPTGGNQTSYTVNGITWSAGGLLPSSTTWTSLAYGNGRFVAIASNSRSVAYSLDKGATWVAATPGLPASQNWSTVRYGQGLFVAVALGTNAIATSPDGITWTARTLPSSSDWKGLVFGNPNKVPTWVVASNTSGTTAASIKTGAKTLGRLKVEDNQITGTRIVEPGSGYPTGAVVSTSSGTSIITLDSVDNLINNQPITFTNVESAGLESGKVYYIVSGSINSGTNEIKVSLIQGTGIAVSVSTTSLSASVFRAGPITEQFDPNKTLTAPVEARLSDGALGNPSFSNRGTQNSTATAEIGGDGYANLYQPSTFISVGGLFDLPEPGSNIEFASIPNAWYKLVTVSNVIGQPGEYTATFQISPGLSVLNAPKYGNLITATNKYSQVRLTGHDFLYIGTGNQADTNYPFVDITTAVQSNQQLSSGGGRVFFTSTDQDGNFNVGNLFGVQQSTGTATLNADAFNLSGLQSLQLGGIAVGVGSAVITQFSTDPFFTANSDNIIPTQRAIKSYITAQIGGGQSSLNVNTLTSGVVFIANDTITTTNGGQLNITAKMNFTGGIDGAPVALGFFLQR